MIRTLKVMNNGLGELTMRPELVEEVEELQRVCPFELPAGVIHGYRWTAPPESGGHLVLFAANDPNYVPAPLTPPKAAGTPGIAPVPTREQLADWTLANLITRAAELSVEHKPGEKKADLIAKMIPAWTKLNAELDKPKHPPS